MTNLTCFNYIYSCNHIKFYEHCYYGITPNNIVFFNFQNKIIQTMKIACTYNMDISLNEYTIIVRIRHTQTIR